MLFLSLLPLAVHAEVWHPVETSAPGEWFIRSVQYSRPVIEKTYLAKLDKLAPYEERLRRDEAVKLLDELFARHYAEAWQFMTSQLAREVK